MSDCQSSHPRMTRLALRWLGTRGLARSAATRRGPVHRPAWSVTPPRARHSRISHLTPLIFVLVLAGCGASGGDYGGAHPDYAKALAGSPAPLAGLHRQADELLGGGQDAYEKRLAALRGYPAVVNIWASWCGPCRFEFPHLQQAAAHYGKRVAFLGVDKQDSDDAAATFLAEAPVPYPSYTDPDEEIAASIDGDATRGLPTTAFYDREGNLAYLKLGPYTDQAELDADIERYALGGGESEGG
jgi:cytochrome c biogenesis protein CcmG, thiol:disulfide interchange protein DsbE